MTSTENLAHRGDTTPARSATGTLEGNGAVAGPQLPRSTSQHLTSVEEGAGMSTVHLHLQVDAGGQTPYEQDPHAARAPEVEQIRDPASSFALVKRFLIQILFTTVECLEFLAFRLAFWLGWCVGLLRYYGREFPGAVYATTIGCVFFLAVLILETAEK
jgi:hypothetical protein